MKPIEEIEFKNHDIFGTQTYKPLKGLNIITSSNGRGKTTLLKYINKSYSKNHRIKSLLASIQHFKDFFKVDDYETKKSTRPPETRQFREEYDVILQLQANKEMIEECNNFFNKLKLRIQLSESNLLTGFLVFKSQNKIKGLTLSDISTGEKTAFILWLITKAKNKPDVLLLDEFDSHMDNEVGMEFKNILQELSKQTQIFISTHNGDMYGNVYDEYAKNKNDNAWHIDDNGKIKP